MSEQANDVNVRVQNRMNFYGPVFIFIGAPISLGSIFFLIVASVTHWSVIVSVSLWIIMGVVVIFGLLAVALVAYVGTHIYGRYAVVRGQRMRNKVLHTDEHYAIIELQGIPHVVPVSIEKYNYNIREVANNQTPLLEGPAARLPDLVRYEDIKADVPKGHTLLGISAEGVITRPHGVRCSCWIVGGSKTGKTNSVSIRVQEDYENGHRFLAIDPHAYKDDSLYNAIKQYAGRFLMPMAQEAEDILPVLDYFLAEFKNRKDGASISFPITIFIDEVGSLTTDKPENKTEEEIQQKIKKIARICGQEGRGFKMYGMFISQDAAGLAWLRKRAMTVIVHKLLMMPERDLATNENDEVARSMDNWPIGRTYIYGLGLDDTFVLQQPVISRQSPIIEGTISDVTIPDIRFPGYVPASSTARPGRYAEASWEEAGSIRKQKEQENESSTVKELREIGKRLRSGETSADIVKSYGLPYGRATQELNAVVDMVAHEMEDL